MLGGIDPIIIFNFPIRLQDSILFATEGLPTEPPTFLEGIGIPVPVYLSESVTGIYVQNENKSIDIETESYPKNDSKKTMLTVQKALNNSVTIQLVANKNSVVLGVLLALSDIVFSKIAAKEYSVSYLNGPTTIFGGLLTGFSTQSDDNTDLLQITMTIWKTSQLRIVPETVTATPNTRGTTPLAG